MIDIRAIGEVDIEIRVHEHLVLFPITGLDLFVVDPFGGKNLRRQR